MEGWTIWLSFEDFEEKFRLSESGIERRHCSATTEGSRDLTRLLGRVEDFYLNFNISRFLWYSRTITDWGDITGEKGNKWKLGKCFCIFVINPTLHFVGQLGGAESELLRKKELKLSYFNVPEWNIFHRSSLVLSATHLCTINWTSSKLGLLWIKTDEQREMES